MPTTRQNSSRTAFRSTFGSKYFMNHSLNESEFDENIVRIGRIFRGIYIVLFISFFLTIALALNIQNQLINNGFDSNRQIGYFTSSIPLLLVFISLVASSVFSINLKRKKIDGLVSNIFEMYHITRFKQFTGYIEFETGMQLKVEWDKKKKYFIISFKEKTLSLTKSKELYWKLLYWNYKLRNLS